MGRFHSLQNNGTAGELSPRLARTDLAKYANGYRLVKNFYPIPQGANTRRPGTRFLVEAVNSAKKSRIIRFVSSANAVYGLEFSLNSIRVHSKDNTTLATIATTYTEAELFEISWAQSADVMYLAHPSHATATLSYSGPTSWALAPIVFDDGPYKPQNTTTTWKLTPGATSGNGVTLTASGAGFTPFTTDDIGKPIRLRHGTTPSLTWGWARIVGYTSTTVVTIDIDPYYVFGATTATDIWCMGAWSAVLGYPSIVTFQENRLVLAANADNPITLWASQSNGYSPTKVLYGPTKTDGTVTADMAITVSLAHNDINKILWMSGGPSLAVGTISAEWLVEAASSTEAWSPSNSKATVQTTRGSRVNTQGIRIETAVVYVQQKGRKLREFTFNFSKNATESNDLMLLADHICMDGIAEIVYVQDPHSYLVARLDNGELRFLTYIGTEDVGGWSRQVIAGVYDGGNAIVESIAVLPDYDLGYDALWMVVKRTIGGVTKRYIEIMQPPFYGNAQSDAWFLDCAVQTTGVSLTEVPADHLDEETLGVFVDGASRPDQPCDFGTIGLDRPGNKVLVGLKYLSSLRTIPPDWAASGRAAALGTALGKQQKLAKVDLHLHETGSGLKVGTSPDALYDVVIRTIADPVDIAPSLFTGWKHHTLGGTYSDEAVLYFEIGSAEPCTLLEYSARGNINES